MCRTSSPMPQRRATARPNALDVDPEHASARRLLRSAAPVRSGRDRHQRMSAASGASGAGSARPRRRSGSAPAAGPMFCITATRKTTSRVVAGGPQRLRNVAGEADPVHGPLQARGALRRRARPARRAACWRLRARPRRRSARRPGASVSTGPLPAICVPCTCAVFSRRSSSKESAMSGRIWREISSVRRLSMTDHACTRVASPGSAGRWPRSGCGRTAARPGRRSRAVRVEPAARAHRAAFARCGSGPAAVPRSLGRRSRAASRRSAAAWSTADERLRARAVRCARSTRAVSATPNGGAPASSWCSTRPQASTSRPPPPLLAQRSGVASPVARPRGVRLACRAPEPLDGRDASAIRRTCAALVDHEMRAAAGRRARGRRRARTRVRAGRRRATRAMSSTARAGCAASHSSSVTPDARSTATKGQCSCTPISSDGARFGCSSRAAPTRAGRASSASAAGAGRRAARHRQHQFDSVRRSCGEPEHRRRALAEQPAQRRSGRRGAASAQWRRMLDGRQSVRQSREGALSWSDWHAVAGMPPMAPISADESERTSVRALGRPAATADLELDDAPPRR